MGSINCSPEPEFIEKIVEVIWKRLKGESSTVQSRRQIDNPGAGEDSSIIISQNDALSVQNAIAEWSRFFFFCVSVNLIKGTWAKFFYFFLIDSIGEVTLNLTKRLSSFFIYLKISNVACGAVRL